MTILKVFEDTKVREKVSFEREAPTWRPITSEGGRDPPALQRSVCRAARSQSQCVFRVSSVLLGRIRASDTWKIAQTAAFQDIEATDLTGIIAAVFSDWAGLKELHFSFR